MSVWCFHFQRGTCTDTLLLDTHFSMTVAVSWRMSTRGPLETVLFNDKKPQTRRRPPQEKRLRTQMDMSALRHSVTPSRKRRYNAVLRLPTKVKNKHNTHRHTHTHKRAQALTHARTRTHTHKHIHTHTHTHTRTHMHSHTHKHTRTHGDERVISHRQVSRVTNMAESCATHMYVSQKPLLMWLWDELLHFSLWHVLSKRRGC